MSFLENLKINCLSYWFPKLVDAGIPVPKTEIIKVDQASLIKEAYAVFDGKRLKGEDKALSTLCASIRSAAEHLGGAPVFLRTGQGSDKHSWTDTCYLSDLKDVRRHVINLIEWSEMAHICGLPTDVWVVREMLPVLSTFVVFKGFPVSRERRCFVKDGKLVCSHPYWPEDAIESARQVSVENWRGLLSDLNCLNVEDTTQVMQLSEKVAKAVSGAWSVDLLYSPPRGWIVTDMAVASDSYHWPGCKKAKRFEGGDDRD